MRLPRRDSLLLGQDGGNGARALPLPPDPPRNAVYSCHEWRAGATRGRRSGATRGRRSGATRSRRSGATGSRRSEAGGRGPEPSGRRQADGRRGRRGTAGRPAAPRRQDAAGRVPGRDVSGRGTWRTAPEPDRVRRSPHPSSHRNHRHGPGIPQPAPEQEGRADTPAGGARRALPPGEAENPDPGARPREAAKIGGEEASFGGQAPASKAGSGGVSAGARIGIGRVNG
jgi:hypothetical protein